MQIIIHGENIIAPVKEMPRKKAEQHKSFTIGHSETGHHHELVAEKGTTFNIILDGDDIYFETKAKSEIVHRKSYDNHETIEVQPGKYRVFKAKEYNPFTKRMQQVWD